jgi:hypothetical protein
MRSREGPTVRIRLPPAASRTNFELILQTLARYPLPDGISGLGGGGRNSRISRIQMSETYYPYPPPRY